MKFTLSSYKIKEATQTPANILDEIVIEPFETRFFQAYWQSNAMWGTGMNTGDLAIDVQFQDNTWNLNVIAGVANPDDFKTRSTLSIPDLLGAVPHYKFPLVIRVRCNSLESLGECQITLVYL